MRIALISDIHANLPAFEAVLEATDDAAVDARWCLGDLVGYGAQPDGCVRLASERCEVCLSGNHDLAVLADLDTSTFSPAAASAAEWTQQNAAPETLEYLRSLSTHALEQDIGLYHASPRDPIWEYVLSTDQAGECMEVQEGRVSFIGHSHVALYFVRLNPEQDGRPPVGPPAVTGAPAPDLLTLDLSSGRWLVNPGSVGQPRDGDPRAAWLELDTELWQATFHRVEYDVGRAEAAILEAGLPESLGRRLHLGQ